MAKAKKALLILPLLVALLFTTLMVSACGKDEGNDGFAHVSDFNQLVVEMEKGGNIKLDTNITLTENIVVSKKVTLDLNGKTITATNESVSGKNNVFNILGGELTITGNGTITATYTRLFTVGLTEDGNYEAGKLVIENGTFNIVEDNENTALVFVASGTAEIKGGTFGPAKLWQGKGYLLNLKDADTLPEGVTAKIVVTGGSFIGFDPSHSESENPVENFLLGGADGDYTVVTDTESVEGETVYTVVLKSSIED